MSRTLTLTDPLALGDLAVYLARAGRVDDGSVRLVAGSGVLAVYTAILYPAGLLDETPTVLGLRTFALSGSVTLDTVVPVRSLLDRISRLRESSAGSTDPVEFGLPMEVSTVTWAGISPPKGGWQRVAEITGGELEQVAKDGIDEVARSVPPGTGEQLVHRIRSEVWGKPMSALDQVAAGAAFAAYSLGFLGRDPAEEIPVFETGPWTRLSSTRGHVLVRRRAWSLLR